MPAEIKEVEIYTDGACRKNPGKGGWGAVLFFPNAQNPKETLEYFGGVQTSTNQRMELIAAIEALSRLKGIHRVKLFSDSHYLTKGLTEWLPQWKQRDWKNADKKNVANQDLWQSLDRLAIFHQIECVWVKGHSGHPANERADALANLGIDSL